MILKKHILSVIFLTIAIVSFGTKAFAKDEWVMVNSKNFKLIGNANEKDIRKVGTKLEQFREVFRLLLTGANLISPIPTTVFVFKNNSAFRPFKPKRADGKTDDFLAGYFQSGEDVNYIALSTEGESAQTLGVIFHEYVHNVVNMNLGKSEIPPWFNEGLAEYYETFEIENDQDVKLGLAEFRHIQLLKENKLIPLETLFNVSNYALHQNGNHSRSIFYAESWALMHYILQGSQSDKVNQDKANQLGAFLELLIKKVPADKAFRDAFHMTYAQMETELKKYVNQSSYKYSIFPFKKKLTFDADMQTVPVSEALTNAYLGDLLLHTNRADDAEPYLQKAVQLDSNMSFANTSLGMVKLRQRKYDESKAYLEKAITDDQKSHLAYYKYAYLLSREGRDEFGYVSRFPAETVAKIRDSLKKAIAINPNFTESYELMAFVNLVNNEQLDESIQYLKKALSLQPGNQMYVIRIAEIYSRQDKLKESRELAENLVKTTDDQEIKARAESLINKIGQIEGINAQNEASRKQYDNAIKQGGGNVPLSRRNQPTEKTLTPEEVAKLQKDEMMISLNQAIRKVDNAAKQTIGHITKITCAGGKITYTVKTEKETLTFFSKDFENLAIVSLSEDSGNTAVGCNENIANLNSVLTYREAIKPAVNGELLAIDFVPNNFEFVDVTKSKGISGLPPGSNSSSAGTEDFDAINKEAMFSAMKKAMRQPLEGEKRSQGFIEKIECDNKAMYFSFKTETQIIKLTNTSPNLHIMGFTPDIQGIQFSCGLKQLDIPVVFTYKPNTDPKAKNQGEVVSLEFVPKSFKLEN